MSEQSNPYEPPAGNVLPSGSPVRPSMSPPGMAEQRERPKSPTWAQQFAKASWGAFVLAFFLVALAARASPVFGGGLVMLFVLFGFVAGVVALIARRGEDQVLVPAIIGLVLNGGLLLIWAVNIADHVY